MDEELLSSLLTDMSPDDLANMFYPYQQEQGVLEQQMSIGQDMRQPGRQYASPIGALLGGLGDVAGSVGGSALQARGLAGQRGLGQQQQKDAVARMMMLEKILRERKSQEMEPDPMDPGEAYEPAEMME